MIRDVLLSMADEKYKEFSCKLVPNVDDDLIIGVRVPRLRAFAKELLKSNAEEREVFMRDLPHRYLEENNLHGLLIEGEKDFNTVIEELERFLPYVDNWETCDIISPRAFKKNADRLEKYVYEWLDSKEPYAVRFGLQMLMIHFLEDRFKEEHLKKVASLDWDHYYVNMGIAWYLSMALAKQYDATIRYFEEGKLYDFPHNKGIQKAIESQQVPAERKEYMRTLRRKSK